MTEVQVNGIENTLSQFGISAPNVSVKNLTLDSRQIRSDTGFVAVKGHVLDGREFIPQAISLGAPIIIQEVDSSEEHGETDMRGNSIIVGFYQLHAHLSELADSFYRHPSQSMCVVAVTGTNGKTSTVQFIAQLSALSGRYAASIGTLGVNLHQNDNTESLGETVNTTPDAIALQRYMSELQTRGIQICTLEASSHGLVQGRLSALNTKVAVFTNLSRDHLDYHGSMADYAGAKRLLLKQSGLEYLVLNSNEAESEKWLQAKPNSIQAVLCSIASDASIPKVHRYCHAKYIQYSSTGCSFQLVSSWGQTNINTSLLGEFNLSNLLQSIAVKLCLGADLSELAEACSAVNSIPGRMEQFCGYQQPTLVVDYAHTPDALAKALTVLRVHCEGHLWCVFGCGGERDAGKRPQMGKVAEDLADKITVTTDNSRSEAPQKIIDEILSGMVMPNQVCVELDREQAIRDTWHNAKAEDVILIAGKGHETVQICGNQHLEFSDREIAKTLQEARSC
jgi:UDP-N-acetylmuramoyl-L-alanyl-D-glutamate--2,6-diaminopimelate ligase